MDSQIEEIKSKLNVLDVVGSYMKLTKTGINYRGVCPFHPEKTPSFFVSPTRQMWHCFGCGLGFSIFDFVMKIEGVEFGDALRILANKAGIELKRENVQLKTERQRLYEICDLACLFFEKQLESSSIGKEAEDYLLKRGITKESIKKWRIGYSPDTWNGLTDFLVGRGYQREEIIKAGLAIEKSARIGYAEGIAGGEGNKSDSYDRFRGRIVFPVFNLNSQVVGFGGRVFKSRLQSPNNIEDSRYNRSNRGSSTVSPSGQDTIAKYINTPQTLIYDKSNLLYGLNNAKLAIRKQNQCVVTEGYTDVIMCHQAGFENTVAASGTALTSQHLNILKRYSENLVLAFDADIAGDSATKRGINSAQIQGFNIKIIGNYLPAQAGLKDTDPADIILKDAKQWDNYVSQAKSIMDYYFDSAFSNFNKTTPEGKKEIGRIILPAIKRLQNKIEQSHWVQKLSEKLEVKEEVVLEELVRVKINSPEELLIDQKPSFEDRQNLGVEGRKKLIEEKVISLILKNPDNIKFIDELHVILFSEKTRRFLEELKKIINQQKITNEDELKVPRPAEQAGIPVAEGDLGNFKKIFENIISDDSEFKNFLAALALRGDLNDEGDGQEEIQLCILHLKNIDLKNKLNKISADIKKAEAKKDSEKVNNFIEEFNKLTKEL